MKKIYVAISIAAITLTGTVLFISATKGQCYIDGNLFLGHQKGYYERSEAWTTRVRESNGVYVFDDLGIRFKLPANPSYYVFQDSFEGWKENYRSLVVMPYSDSGCRGIDLFNRIQASDEPFPGMPGGEEMTNQNVIKTTETLGNKTFAVITIPHETLSPYMNFYFDHGSRHYLFSAGRSEQDKEVMRELLETLEFVE